MGTRVRSSQQTPSTLKSFYRARAAFTGAEKALTLAFALAIVVLGGALLSSGSQRAGSDARTTLLQGLAAPAGSLQGLHFRDAPRAVPRPGQEQSAGAGPTAQDGALAAKPGNSPAQQAARRLVAEDFYVKQAGFVPARAQSHLAGIDYGQPVQIVGFPPPGQLDQHIGANGRIGNYFAPVGTPAGQLGINPAGRTVHTFHIPQGQGLQSTAAPIVDTWTDPAHPYQAQGGGTQIFVTDAQRDAIKAHNNVP